MHDTTVSPIAVEPLNNVGSSTPAAPEDPDAAQRARRALELAETAPDGTPALAPACKIVPTTRAAEPSTRTDEPTTRAAELSAAAVAATAHRDEPSAR